MAKKSPIVKLGWCIGCCQLTYVIDDICPECVKGKNGGMK